jgi:hypothetical protein
MTPFAWSSDGRGVYVGAVTGEGTQTTNSLSTQTPPTWVASDFNNRLDVGFVSSIAVHPADSSTA